MSKQLEKTYNPKAIEPKLYDRWLEKKYFHAEVDRSKKPFTIVMPPPNITLASTLPDFLYCCLNSTLVHHLCLETEKFLCLSLLVMPTHTPI